jgi:hypothetical protein
MYGKPLIRIEEEIPITGFNQSVVIEKICNVTNELYSLKIDMGEYMDYKKGHRYIQDVFDYMTPEEREFIISGLTPSEFDKLFPPEE